MTSSAEHAAAPVTPAIDPLPPALSSMWRLCRLGYRHEPRLMLAALALSQLAALPDALVALWLMFLGQGVLEKRPGLVLASALGLGLSAAATWFLVTMSTRVQRRFRDKVTIALESHVARLQASIVTIAHHERPEFLDRLSMLRNQVFVLDHMYMSVFAMCGWILRLGITVALLAAIHPALVLLAVFALPTVLTSTWRPAVERVAHERAAQAARLARHLFTIATTAAPGKEVRVAAIGDRLLAQRREAFERAYAPVAAARWSSAIWHTLAWAHFRRRFSALGARWVHSGYSRSLSVCSRFRDLDRASIKPKLSLERGTLAMIRVGLRRGNGDTSREFCRRGNVTLQALKVY